LHAPEKLHELRAFISIGHLTEIATAWGFVVFQIGAISRALEGFAAFTTPLQLAFGNERRAVFNDAWNRWFLSICGEHSKSHCGKEDLTLHEDSR